MDNSHRPRKADITPPSAPRPDGVKLRARRSPKLIALGVLLVVLGGLGAAALYLSTADYRPVVVMAKSVQRGDVIQRADLTVVEVPSTLGVKGLGASDLTGIVGQQALSDLPEGAFPSRSLVGDDPLPDGQSIVGLRLPLGRVPTSSMPPGTPVRLVSLAEGAEAQADAVVATGPQLLDDGASYALDVQVPDAAAELVARLSATDQLAVIVVGAA